MPSWSAHRSVGCPGSFPGFFDGEGLRLTSDQFEREMRYQAMLAIFRTMLGKGLLAKDDFEKIEGYLREKYQPIFCAA